MFLNLFVFGINFNNTFGPRIHPIMINVAIPFVNILGSLPISWQGLGVRETAYIFFLSSYLSNEQAVAFGAMWFLGVTVSSAIGGVVSALTGELKVLKANPLNA